MTTTDIIEDPSTYNATISVPANATGNHGQLKTVTIQALANRTGHFRARQLAGWEHPMRVGTKASMAALTGMAAGDMFYASDVERMYRWQSGAYSAEFSSDGDNLIAGTTGVWVRMGMGGFASRKELSIVNPGGTHAIAGTYGAVALFEVALGPHKAGDILDCQASFMVGGLTGTGQLNFKLVYNNGSGDVDVTGSETFRFADTASPLHVLLPGRHAIPADKATGTVKVFAQRVGPSAASIDFTGGSKQQSLLVRVLVP